MEETTVLNSNVLLFVGAVILAVVLFYFFSKSKKTEGAAKGSGFKNLNVAEAKTFIANEKPVILDVRTAAEVAQGKIAGAKELNVMSPSFANGLKDLDPAKSYLVYCRSGRRSVRACQIMEKHGFQNLHNLVGGYNAWS